MNNDKVEGIIKLLEETVNIDLPLTDSQRLELVRTFIKNMKIRTEMDSK